MNRLAINKDSEIDHKKATEPLAVTEIWYGDEAVWTNRDGLKPVDLLEI